MISFVLTVKNPVFGEPDDDLLLLALKPQMLSNRNASPNRELPDSICKHI